MSQLEEQLEAEASEIIAYDSAITGSRENKTAVLLRNAAKALTSWRQRAYGAEDELKTATDEIKRLNETCHCG